MRPGSQSANAGISTSSGPGDIVVPLRLRHAGRELSFFSTVTTFGTPLDVTVSELAIESFFPADPETASVLRELLDQSFASGIGGGD